MVMQAMSHFWARITSWFLYYCLSSVVSSIHVWTDSNTSGVRAFTKPSSISGQDDQNSNPSRLSCDSGDQSYSCLRQDSFRDTESVELSRRMLRPLESMALMRQLIYEAHLLLEDTFWHKELSQLYWEGALDSPNSSGAVKHKVENLARAREKQIGVRKEVAELRAAGSKRQADDLEQAAQAWWVAFNHHWDAKMKNAQVQDAKRAIPLGSPKSGSKRGGKSPRGRRKDPRRSDGSTAPGSPSKDFFGTHNWPGQHTLQHKESKKLVIL